MSEWLLFALMSLASYRLTRLVVTDDFPPVLWVRDRLAGGWRTLTEAEENGDLKSLGKLGDVDGELQRFVERARWSPAWLAALLSCTWCASGWVSMGVVAAVDVHTGLEAPVLVWLGVWALSSVLAAQEWA